MKGIVFDLLQEVVVREFGGADLGFAAGKDATRRGLHVVGKLPR